MTKIEWVRNRDGSAGLSWNPTAGCSRASEGCDNCYAMLFEHRFSGPGQRSEGLTLYRQTGAHAGVDWSGIVRLDPRKLAIPIRRKKPTTWFVNSTSDAFHPALSNEEVAAIFGVMAATPHHTYLLLTKRADRLPEWFAWADDCDGGASNRIHGAAFDALSGAPEASVVWNHGSTPWPLPNLVLGVSVENQRWADERIPHLMSVPASRRFVSAEPLLGRIDFGKVPGLNKVGSLGHDIVRHLWVIVGGESGRNPRPCNVEWIRSIVAQCDAARVPCFVKQLGRFAYSDRGGHRSFAEDVSDGTSKGNNIDAWPEDLRRREMFR